MLTGAEGRLRRGALSRSKPCFYRSSIRARSRGHHQPQAAQLAARTPNTEIFPPDSAADALVSFLHSPPGQSSPRSFVAQLNDTIAQARSWRELSDVLESSWARVDFVNVSTAWTRLATLYSRAPGLEHDVEADVEPPAQDPAFRQFLGQLIAVTSAHLRDFGVRALANVMWAMSNADWRLEEHEPAVSELVHDWSAAVEGRVHELGPADVSNICCAVGRLDSRWRPEFVVAFYRSVLQREELLHRLDVTAVNQVLYGLSRSQRRRLITVGPETRRRLAGCVARLLERYSFAEPAGSDASASPSASTNGSASSGGLSRSSSGGDSFSGASSNGAAFAGSSEINGTFAHGPSTSGQPSHVVTSGLTVVINGATAAAAAASTSDRLLPGSNGACGCGLPGPGPGPGPNSNLRHASSSTSTSSAAASPSTSAPTPTAHDRGRGGLAPWRAAQLLYNCHKLRLPLQSHAYRALMPVVAQVYGQRPSPLDHWSFSFLTGFVDAHRRVHRQLRPDLDPLYQYVEGRLGEGGASQLAMLAHAFGEMQVPVRARFWGYVFARYMGPGLGQGLGAGAVAAGAAAVAAAAAGPGGLGAAAGAGAAAPGAAAGVRGVESQSQHSPPGQHSGPSSAPAPSIVRRLWSRAFVDVAAPLPQGQALGHLADPPPSPAQSHHPDHASEPFHQPQPHHRAQAQSPPHQQHPQPQPQAEDEPARGPSAASAPRPLDTHPQRPGRSRPPAPSASPPPDPAAPPPERLLPPPMQRMPSCRLHAQHPPPQAWVQADYDNEFGPIRLRSPATEDALEPATLHFVCWQSAKAGILPPRAFLRLYVDRVPEWLERRASDRQLAQAVETLQLLQWVPRRDMSDALCYGLERAALRSKLPLRRLARWVYAQRQQAPSPAPSLPGSATASRDEAGGALAGEGRGGGGRDRDMEPQQPPRGQQPWR
ncbi:hypothetical protein HYH03_000345 [Edaphochlamys debaryana]|uniref:Uncharacterized protein n=1 Tax=Edaphochlamys debaryana TaxID=47281 RepID=A0A835YHC0_9CHLO|nr:hypothetical protein HYH03_000345 [Edaphochlamys debaryana]|eukprot:KAG2501847.1 hypothetical protein HYH03_000345 [Edaphochlamys debaryana]